MKGHHMDWKSRANYLEMQDDWRPAIAYLESLVITESSDVEVWIRLIYLMHDVVLERHASVAEANNLREKLLHYFERSYGMWCTNPEYLFFVGKRMHIAEWYFGQDDTALALEMEQKAAESLPRNILYEWGYIFSIGDSPTSSALSRYIMKYRGDIIESLSEGGYPGSYILMFLEGNSKKETA